MTKDNDERQVLVSRKPLFSRRHGTIWAILVVVMMTSFRRNSAPLSGSLQAFKTDDTVLKPAKMTTNRNNSATLMMMNDTGTDSVVDIGEGSGHSGGSREKVNESSRGGNMTTWSNSSFPPPSSSSSSSQPWTDVIDDSNEYFWGNNQNITYRTELSMDTTNAKLSVRVSFHDPQQTCPYPYFRGRLSGSAVVRIPLRNPDYLRAGAKGRTNAAEAHVSGDVWIPVPGTYFLEILLVHCTMDAMVLRRTTKQLKHRCAVVPLVRPDVKDYQFVVGPFQRTKQSIKEWMNAVRSPFRYGVWVLAPPCNATESTYRIGPECTRTSSIQPKMIRTKVQTPGYLEFMGLKPQTKSFNSDQIKGRFLNHVFLPVNRSDGTVDYEHHHATSTYVPPIEGLSTATLEEKNKTLCFVGDSFSGYYHREASLILKNATYGTTACSNKFHMSADHKDSWNTSFVLLGVPMANDWFDREKDADVPFSKCAAVFVSVGRWEAGFPGRRPTLPKTFRFDFVKMLEELEGLTPPTAKHYFMSTGPMAIGSRIIDCIDWRVPPMMDAYNTLMMDHTELQDKADGLPKFLNMNKTYYLDTTDIDDPLDDDMDDWQHACRNVFRVVDVRMLELAAKDLKVAGTT